MCTGETETPFPVDKGDMISVTESFFVTDVMLEWINSNYFWYVEYFLLIIEFVLVRVK